MSAKTTPEKAFKRATAGYEVFGKKLFPFSAMRQGAATSMGMRYGLIDQQDIFTFKFEQLKNGKKTEKELESYNQLFADVVKVLWLCSVPDSRVLRAERKIEEARIEAYKWADANGISSHSKNYQASASIFFQIMQDIAAAEGQIVSKGNQPDDDDEGND